MATASHGCSLLSRRCNDFVVGGGCIARAECRSFTETVLLRLNVDIDDCR